MAARAHYAQVKQAGAVSTHTYADGTTYTGEWKDGRRHGQGTYAYAYGTTYTGEWKDGERNDKGIEAHPDGTKYPGEFKDGLPAP